MSTPLQACQHRIKTDGADAYWIEGCNCAELQQRIGELEQERDIARLLKDGCYENARLVSEEKDDLEKERDTLRAELAAKDTAIRSAETDAAFHEAEFRRELHRAETAERDAAVAKLLFTEPTDEHAQVEQEATLVSNILRWWQRWRIERFAIHLLGDAWTNLQARIETAERERDAAKEALDGAKARIDAAYELLGSALHSKRLTREWYSAKWKRLEDFLKERGLWNDDTCSILVNGEPSVLGPYNKHELEHEHDRQLNLMRFRAEAAEQDLAAKDRELAVERDELHEIAAAVGLEGPVTGAVIRAHIELREQELREAREANLMLREQQKSDFDRAEEAERRAGELLSTIIDIGYHKDCDESMEPWVTCQDCSGAGRHESMIQHDKSCRVARAEEALKEKAGEVE